MERNSDLDSEDDGLIIHTTKGLKQISQATKAANLYLIPEKAKLQSLQRYIGKTPLLRCNNLAKYLSCERLYVKFEGSNPTGTQKDRISYAICEYAYRMNFTNITAASCGNFGVSLSYFGRILGMNVHIFIPLNYHVPKDRLERMQHYGALIHYIPGTYEDAVEVSKRFAEDNDYFDANPGSQIISSISVKAYESIAYELQSQLRNTPDYVIAPVGNGTTLAGIFTGFQELYDNGKIKCIPRIIASSTLRGNPIVNSFKRKEMTIMDLDPLKIKETKINEPLINWHSYDGQIALDSLYSSNGYAEYAQDSEMIKISKLLVREEGINALPASASSLAIIPKLYKDANGLFQRQRDKLKGTIVSVLSGRGV